ncbi:MAG TPA: hypothetical protein VFE19_02305 [Jatrophihabitantaceae bacterium]|jgi:hypothetical protein|nr:hypothetical protein [Jatrophihabitantaceae bacterium]
MTVTGVSDEVWDRLDPTEARLSRATRIKVAAWAAAAAVVTSAVLLLSASGLFIHRFSIGQVNESGDPRSCVETLTIKNDGWFTEHVVGQTLLARGTGASVIRGIGSDIPSGGSRTIRLRYSPAWCERLAHSSPFTQPANPALVLHLHRPWGKSTATVVLKPPLDAEGLTVQW